MTPLGRASVKTNILKRDLIKHKLTNNLKPLVKDALAESEFLFRNNINKRNDINKKISHLSSTNSDL